MTPREMAAEDLSEALGNVKDAGLELTAEAFDGHIAALRARADAAVNAMADVTEALLGERPVGVMRETTLEAVHALRARAEAAEADNAVLLRVASCGVEHDYQGLCPDKTQPESRDPACTACAVMLAPHPGTGYRAKVRAELLLELAMERRDRAKSLAAVGLDAASDAAEALADVYEAQAAREEQG